jgi:hypothetical protein
MSIAEFIPSECAHIAVIIVPGATFANPCNSIRSLTAVDLGIISFYIMKPGDSLF